VCSPYPAVHLVGTPHQRWTRRETRAGPGQIFDPYSTRIVGGQQVRTPYPNNIMPATSLDRVFAGDSGATATAERTGRHQQLQRPGLHQLPAHHEWSPPNWIISISPTIKISGYYSQLKTFAPNVNGGILPLALGEPPPTTIPHDPDELRPDHYLDFAFPCRDWLFRNLGTATLPRRSLRASIGLSGYQANMIMPDISGISGAQGGL